MQRLEQHQACAEINGFLTNNSTFKCWAEEHSNDELGSGLMLEEKQIDVRRQVQIAVPPPTPSDGQDDTPSAEINASPHHVQRYSRARPQKTFGVESYLVNFKQLLANKEAPRMVKGIDNMDLLHGAAGLYSLSLPEVEHDTIYQCMHNKDAFTILVLLSVDSAKEHCLASLKLKDRRQKKHDAEKNDLEDDEDDKMKNTRGGGGDVGSDDSDEWEDESDDDDDESVDSDDDESDEDDKFDGLYSDYELSSADEDSDDEDDDDSYEAPMSTMDDFLDQMRKRRDELDDFFKNHEHRSLTAQEIPDKLIGIERRLVACITCERYHKMAPEKVLVITLLSTRRKYKGLGIGKLIMTYVRDSRLSGDNNVIIVNADEAAVGFFRKQGFTSDVLLNSPYQKIHNTWLNTRRMIRYCDFNGDHSKEPNTCDSKPLNGFELREMALELDSWKDKSIQAHHKLSINMERMKSEIHNLNSRVVAKDEEIERLRAKLNKYQLKEGGGGVVNDHMKTRHSQTIPQSSGTKHQQAARNQLLTSFKEPTGQNWKQPFSSPPSLTDGSFGTDEALLQNRRIIELILRNYLPLKNMMPPPQKSEESRNGNTTGTSIISEGSGKLESLLTKFDEIKRGLNHEKEVVCERERKLKQALNQSLMLPEDTTLVRKLTPAQQLVSRFDAVRNLHQDHTTLVYCGTRLDSDSVDRIAASGFDSSHFAPNQTGIRFTKSASKAKSLLSATTTPDDNDVMLLACKVVLGRCNDVTDADNDVINKDDYDSTVLVEEDTYLVFDTGFVLPHSIVQLNQ